MKKLLIFLILCSLISICAYAQEKGIEDTLEIPSDETLKNFVEKYPEITVLMLKKLYILEHSKPTIVFPEIVILETTDGSATVEYSDSMIFMVGNETYNLLYDIELKPKDVVIARRECPEFPWGLVIGLPVGSFTAGLVIGIIIKNINF